MNGYRLVTEDEKRRPGRPSAVYRTILVEFLARPDTKMRVEADDVGHLALNEGLRSAIKASTLFDEVTVERVGEVVYLSKPEDFWAVRRRD